MNYKLSNKTEKESAKGTKYVSATLTDTTGKEYKGVNAFKGEFAADVWVGELEQNGNFWNLITPKQSAGTNFKTATIEKAMDKKAQNIAAAQDRSAWMWAKTNAATLLQGHAYLKDRPIEEISEAVIKLATLIYNGEPTEPFTSPKTHQTSPSEDFPDGVDAYNHPFTTDAERANMDETEGNSYLQHLIEIDGD